MKKTVKERAPSRLDVNRLIEKIRNHPEFGRIGMILCHNGVVRSTSRSGEGVTEIAVRADRRKLAEIIRDIGKMPGIIAVEAEIAEGVLYPGDDIMAVAIGGDFRENVFAALIEAVNRVKAEVTAKTEKKG